MNIYIYIYIHKRVIDLLYTILFISFIHLNAFVIFFIALCVPTLVFGLVMNMIIIWIFFHFIGKSFYLFSFF